MKRPRVPCVHGIDREICPLHTPQTKDRQALTAPFRVSVNMAPEAVEFLHANASRRNRQ